MQYPNQLKKTHQAVINYGNRGMNLEHLLNLSNSYYVLEDIALIYKKPTPIGVIDVHYSTKGKIIDKAFFKAPSTLDYNGLYRGKYIEFEAKETKVKTSFPLHNIHPHQIKHIRNVLRHHGIVFLIIQFLQGVYLLKGEDFLDYIDHQKRKSIPFSYIQEKGHLIREQIDPPLDYLKVVDQIYFGGIYEKIEN